VFFSLLLFYLYFNLVDIVFEIAFFGSVVREGHFAISVLDASIPFALVPRAISPAHFSITVPIIFEVLTLVLVSTCPDEATETMLAIVLVLSIVDIARRTFSTAPLSFSMFHSSLEESNIRCSISPSVLTLAIRLSM
jgi:hypothetical protein